MEADGREALGRSRGGLTSKVHFLADDRARPLVWETSPGQRGDNPMLVPVLERLRICRHGPGRPRTRPDRLRGDKAYASRSTAERCVSKWKQFRAVAGRYDKRDYIFNGTPTVAAMIIWLRDTVQEPSETP